MAATNPGFEVVGGTETEPRDPPAPDNAAAVRLLQIALIALSQRALIAAADLFTLLTVASAFWLWWSIPAPNDRQIIALSIYALFVLAANWIVRGRK
jgi:hypothetical protein